jgi:CspA family cold shock protein
MQALSVRILEQPPSMQRMARPSADDMAARIEDLIKVLDREGANLRRGRYPDSQHGHRIAAVLRRVADDFDS